MSPRAILFDIYGTLIRSTASDLHHDPRLREIIARHHAASPYPHPEIDIRDIHAELHPTLSPHEIETLAREHEERCNPVGPMPGAAATLRQLSAKGIRLGLISNAQCHTAPILEQTLGFTRAELGIDPTLQVFSYLERRAKPDTHLFEIPRDLLAHQGIAAHDVLYVGNDVRNDIAPARASGFRTALFAGDATSLRLRGKSLENSGADLVITDLLQLIAL